MVENNGLAWNLPVLQQWEEQAVATSASLVPERERMPAPKTHAKTPALQYWRIRRHWTQRELAQAAGVAESTVAHGEQGYALSLLTTRKLADALGISIQQLREEELQS
jgi:DNA-binding XRE family transcriptional regulator